MNKNTITVFLPTYNRIDLLRKALDSCFEQTYTNFDLIISDNNSTDGTQEYLKNVKSDKIDIKILQNEENVGLKSWNKALQHVSTPWVTILCDDDYFEKTFIEESLCIINKMACSLIIVGFNDVSMNEEVIKSSQYTYGYYTKEEFIVKGYLENKLASTAGVSAFLIQSSLLKKSAPLKLYPQGFWTDTFLVIEASMKNGVFFTDKKLYNRRIWGNATSSKMYSKAVFFFEAFFMHCSDLVKLLNENGFEEQIINRVSKSMSYKQFLLGLLPIAKHSYITIEDAKKMMALALTYNKNYIPHMLFFCLLTVFLNKYTLKSRQMFICFLKKVKLYS